jgi:hypothetical protein
MAIAIGTMAIEIVLSKLCIVKVYLDGFQFVIKCSHSSVLIP